MDKKCKNDSKRYLSLLSDTAMKMWLRDNGFPEYRSMQLFKWIFDQWETDPQRMKNLPVELRKKLAADFLCNATERIDVSESSDKTKKLLISLFDRECIESVIIPSDEGRLTFCLSSQVGCAIGCRFCASGAGGLVRNLHAGEIIGQLLLCCREAGAKPDNLVFMGIGEPLMNVKNMLEALDIISSPGRFAMSPRRITISTSGRTNGIKSLAQTKKPYNLAVSLHGPDDATRVKLIPLKNLKPLREILDACTFYRQETGRMITFEYTLIEGVNSSIGQAEKLAKLAKEHRAKINIIPFNQISGSEYKSPVKDDVRRFLHILKVHGAQATCRVKKGSPVNAACGQLRATGKTVAPPMPFQA